MFSAPSPPTRDQKKNLPVPSLGDLDKVGMQPGFNSVSKNLFYFIIIIILRSRLIQNSLDQSFLKIFCQWPVNEPETGNVHLVLLLLVLPSKQDVLKKKKKEFWAIWPL